METPATPELICDERTTSLRDLSRCCAFQASKQQTSNMSSSPVTRSSGKRPTRSKPKPQTDDASSEYSVDGEDGGSSSSESIQLQQQQRNRGPRSRKPRSRSQRAKKAAQRTRKISGRNWSAKKRLRCTFGLATTKKPTKIPGSQSSGPIDPTFTKCTECQKTDWS